MMESNDDDDAKINILLHLRKAFSPCFMDLVQAVNAMIMLSALRHPPEG